MEKAKQLKRMASLFLSYKRKRITCPYLPVRIWIEPTNFCNLRCIYCPQSEGSTKPGYMEFDLYRKIIDELDGSAYDVNLCHRGESLFHPKITEMIDYANEKGIHTRLHTNATIMTEKVSRKLLGTELDLLSFSFDGYERETYERVRVGGNFEQVLGNIITFLRLKKEMRRKKPYTILQVIDQVGKREESHRKKSFMRQLRGLPLDKFYVKLPHNWAGNIPGEGEGVGGGSYSPCTFCWYALTILWDGTVLACPQDYYAKLVLGNVAEESLLRIWNAEKIRKLRRKMANGEVKSTVPCKYCDRLWRRTVLGVPVTNIRAFLGENVAGYNLVRKVVKR